MDHDQRRQQGMPATHECPGPFYEIRLQGHLDVRWSAWLDGLAVTHEQDGITLLSGTLADQAALHGILVRIRDLGVALVSVQRTACEERVQRSKVPMQITMVGHSTVLIEVGEQKVLTDPYFGVWGNVAYARLAPSVRTREQLQDVNLVLISHNHWDHTDRAFLRALRKEVPVLTPRRARWMTRLLGARAPMGMRTWEQVQYGAVTVTAVPAWHIAVTAGYVLESQGKTIYFAGDTYYGSFMQQIGQRFQLDLALIPVTTFRAPMTMGEAGAVRAVRDLKPAMVIPVHLGVTPRSPLLRTSQTAGSFARRVSEAGLETEVVLLRDGESYALGGSP